LVEGLEAEFQREFVAAQVDADHDRVLLLGGDDRKPHPAIHDTLEELARLVDSWGEVLHSTRRTHPQTVVGEGKVQEIALTAQTLGAI